MPHLMSTPCRVVDKLEAKASIEALCSGIAFVHQQSYGLFVAFQLNDYVQQRLGQSLVTIALVYSKRVDIVLACLRLVVHATEILLQEFIGCLEESFAQSMQISTVVTYDDTSHHRLPIGCGVIKSNHRIAITVLAVFSSDQCCHHAMEVL